jgi:poly(A) polymerase
LDAVLQADGSLPEGWHGELIRQALTDTDARVAEGRSVSPSFLLACLLWGEVKSRWAAIRAQGEAVVPALQQAIEQVFDARIGDISGRGKLAGDMREIWLMQPRFERRAGSGPFSLVEQPRYRAGFDFLRLRADAGDADSTLADWWEDFALGSEDDRRALLEDAKAAERRQPRPVAAEGELPLTEPAKKRRRRRRPSKKGEGEAAAPSAE